jgi:hypothetical protein
VGLAVKHASNSGPLANQDASSAVLYLDLNTGWVRAEALHQVWDLLPLVDQVSSSTASVIA